MQIAEIEKAKANIEETYTDQKDMEAALAALQASKDKIVKEKAATTLQMNVRIFLNKLRVKKADLTEDCARTIAKAIGYIVPTGKSAVKFARKAYRVVTQPLLSYLVRQREIRPKRRRNCIVSSLSRQTIY